MARGAHGDRSVLGADCACSMLMGWTLWPDGVCRVGSRKILLCGHEGMVVGTW